MNSLVVLPRLGSTIKTSTPIITGIMKNNKQKPIKNKPVTVYIDNRKVATVKTNQIGVWSYQLKEAQKLSSGAHSVLASVQTGLAAPDYARGTLFYVQSCAEANNIYKSGTVDAANSAISYPFFESFVNDSTPTIIGSLLDTNFNAVSGETVILKIDGSIVAQISSDANGIFSFTPTTALQDGAHTLEAYCVETLASLESVMFTLDTQAPDAPSIITPLENAVITNGIALVSGSSEAYATIATFLDNNSYADVCYSDEFGDWSIEYEVADGNHSVIAQACDLAGNTSPVSQARVFSALEVIS
ncbi:MAG: hypothetical protein IT346_01800 [Epsilonproteobacteria bacterium]|nr:hypothetical protein [Campylobacterota bacterium]